MILTVTRCYCCCTAADNYGGGGGCGVGILCVFLFSRRGYQSRFSRRGYQSRIHIYILSLYPPCSLSPPQSKHSCWIYLDNPAAATDKAVGEVEGACRHTQRRALGLNAGKLNAGGLTRQTMFEEGALLTVLGSACAQGTSISAAGPYARFPSSAASGRAEPEGGAPWARPCRCRYASPAAMCPVYLPPGASGSAAAACPRKQRTLRVSSFLRPCGVKAWPWDPCAHLMVLNEFSWAKC